MICPFPNCPIVADFLTSNASQGHECLDRRQALICMVTANRLPVCQLIQKPSRPTRVTLLSITWDAHALSFKSRAWISWLTEGSDLYGHGWRVGLATGVLLGAQGLHTKHRHTSTVTHKHKHTNTHKFAAPLIRTHTDLALTQTHSHTHTHAHTHTHPHSHISTLTHTHTHTHSHRLHQV